MGVYKLQQRQFLFWFDFLVCPWPFYRFTGLPSDFRFIFFFFFFPVERLRYSTTKSEDKITSSHYSTWSDKTISMKFVALRSANESLASTSVTSVTNLTNTRRRVLHLKQHAKLCCCFEGGKKIGQGRTKLRWYLVNRAVKMHSSIQKEKRYISSK